jgi:ribosome-associated protein
MITPQEMAETIVKTLGDKIARDIKLLKVSDLSVIADYFVICTANSTTQIKNLCDEVEKVMEEQGETLLHREGYREGGWVLLDFGCVVVHVFLELVREFYGLERLWSDAQDIDVTALVGQR